MEIVRGDHESHFTIIANQVSRDERLSFRARGVHHYLLSFPSGWRIDSTTIARAGKEGRDAIRAALKELEAAGYLKRSQIQGKDGRWRTETVIFEMPRTDDAPTPEKPTSGIPPVGESGAIKKKNEKKNEKNLLPVDTTVDHLADAWWRAYKERMGGKSPIGKRAWFALRNVIRASLDAGWSAEDVYAALARCETVPSAAFFERALQGSGARRTAGEDRLRRDLEFLAKIAQSASEPPLREIER